MKRTLPVVAFCVCTALTLPHARVAQAQDSAKTPAAMPTANPVANSLRLLQQRFQNNTIEAIAAMPGDKFSYKPTPDQMTFAHLAAHIANANNFYCPKVADVPAPGVDEVKDTESKDQLVAAVKASFSVCTDALSKMDDSKLGDTVELFGGRQLPRAAAVLGLAAAWSDHYGAAAMYLRLNGLLPPSAQPKK